MIWSSESRQFFAVLSGELTEHLGYDKHACSETRRTNARNGYSQKRIQVKEGELELSIPRDRQGNFEPPLIV